MLQGIRWLPAVVRMGFFSPSALYNWLDALARVFRLCLKEWGLENLSKNKNTPLYSTDWDQMGHALLYDEQPISIWLYPVCFMVRSCKLHVCTSVSHPGRLELTVLRGRCSALQLEPNLSDLAASISPCRSSFLISLWASSQTMQMKALQLGVALTQALAWYNEIFFMGSPFVIINNV